MNQKLKDKLKEKIMQYDIQDMEDPEENKHFCICNRRIVLDLINLEDFVNDIIKKPFVKFDKGEEIKKWIENTKKEYLENQKS